LDTPSYASSKWASSVIHSFNFVGMFLVYGLLPCTRADCSTRLKIIRSRM